MKRRGQNIRAGHLQGLLKVPSWEAGGAPDHVPAWSGIASFSLTWEKASLGHPGEGWS